MTQDSHGTIHLAGEVNLHLASDLERTADAFLTLRLGTTHLLFEEEPIAERSWTTLVSALRSPVNDEGIHASSIPRRRDEEFTRRIDASQLGFMARYRGGADVSASVVNEGFGPHLKLTLGRLDIRAHDQTALESMLYLFRSAAELAPRVFLQAIKLPEPRITQPPAHAVDEHESPEVLRFPVRPVYQRVGRRASRPRTNGRSLPTRGLI